MWTDLRQSLRALGRAPLFTVIAILSLGLGIGANTAIFSLMDQVLVRALPVVDPSRLVIFRSEGSIQGWSTADNYQTVFSYPLYQDLRDRSEVFSDVFARAGTTVTVSHSDTPDRARAEVVTGNYFRGLGVAAFRGRLIAPEDDTTRGGHPVVVLNHAYWQARLGGDEAITGRTVRINNSPMTVIGIAEPGFHGVLRGEKVDLYIPLAMMDALAPNWPGSDKRDVHWLNIFGRLGPRLTRERAEAAMATVYRPVLEHDLTFLDNPPQRFRDEYLRKRLELRPAAQGINDLRAQWQTPFVALMVLVGFVLLIACANIANLMIARGMARQREVAIRLAMGAGRARIIRQVLTESLVLALAGGACGLLFAAWTSEALLGLLPGDSFRTVFSAAVDARLLIFTAAASVLTGILFGLFPAIQAARSEPGPALKDAATAATASRTAVRLRKGLVAAQVGLSTVLLIAAGLFARSLNNLLRDSPGFQPENLITFSLNPRLSGYDPPRALTFYRALHQRLAALPGVRAVGAAGLAPLSGNNRGGNITVEGYAAGEDEYTGSQVNSAGPGFFEAIGISLRQGREFTERDNAQAPKVAVVNESFVRKYFAGRNPLGGRFTFGGGRVTPNIEIVGVAANSKHAGLRDDIPPFVFIPYEQDNVVDTLNFYLRTDWDAAAVSAAVRQAIRELDGSLPLFDLKTVRTQMEESVYRERLVAILAGAFGCLATLLGAIGLYGVIAFMVARRTAEIAIRIALGALRGDVVRGVLREVAVMTAIGIASGVLAALALGRYVESQMFGISVRDPLSFSVAVVVLGVVAGLAGLLPALRAARTDPIRALRYE